MLKFIWNIQTPSTAKTVLFNEKALRGATIWSYTIDYCYNWHISQQNGIIDWDKSQHFYRNPVSEKMQKYLLEEKTQFLHKWSWLNWIAIYRKMKLHPYLLPGTKFNFKWLN